MSPTPTLTLGRDPSTDITLADPSVSRLHAELVLLDDRQIFVRDLGGSNGTTLLRAGARSRLEQDIISSGDEIAFGDVALSFDTLRDMLRAALDRVEQWPDPRVSAADAPINDPVNRKGDTPARASSSVRESGAKPGFADFVPLGAGFRLMRERGMLLPGIAFVIFISRLYWLMSNSGEHPEYTAQFVIEFSIFTALVSFIVVYRLCGKAKPYLAIGGVMAAEVVILSLHSVVSLPFCEATGANAIFKQQDTALAQQSAALMPGFLATFWAYLTCAGLLEELEKMLPVFGLIWFARRSTRTDTRRWGVFEPLDAIVYASAAALTFIMLETFSSDASYVGSDIAKALTKSALEGRLTALFSFPTAILRTIDALAGHIAYSGYFAYFVGLGLLRPQHRDRYWLGGWFATALIHGLYDATTGSTVMRTLSLAVTFFLLIAAILNARKVSPTRDENFATRAFRQPRS